MPYAMSLTIATLLQSIFLDVLLVISAPLGRSLAKKIGKNGTARMATAMAIGLECGIVLTVPGVGALALAGLLGVPLGKMLLFGVLLVIPTVAIAVAIMSFLFNHGWWNPERDEQEFLGADPEPLDDDDDEPSSGATTPDDDGPSGGGVATKTATVTRAQTPLIVLFAPMLASLVLIATGAILDAVDIHNPIVKFVSSPVIALLIGLIGTSFVGRLHAGGRADSARDRHRLQGERTDPDPDRRGRLAGRHHQGGRARRHPGRVLHRQHRRPAARSVGSSPQRCTSPSAP